MLKSKNQFIQIFLIILALLSYVYGFNIREDSAGGGFTIFKIPGIINLPLMKIH